MTSTQLARAHIKNNLYKSRKETFKFEKKFKNYIEI
jgi:hypothetical protein